MSEVGDRMDQAEVRLQLCCEDRNLRPQIDRLFKGPFTENGNFKYREWIKVVRVNDEVEQADGR